RETAAPVDAILAGKGGDAALGIQNVKLPAVTTAIGGGERADDVLRALALAQQFYAVDAVIGIDQRLRCDAAEAGRDMRHPGAEEKNRGGARDADLAGLLVGGEDRPGHPNPSPPPPALRGEGVGVGGSLHESR